MPVPDTTSTSTVEAPSPAEVLAALEERVIAGDSSVTDAQLLKARQAADVAALRARAAAAADERAALAARDAAREALRAEVATVSRDELQALRSRYQDVLDALADVHGLLATHTANTSDLAHRAAALDLKPAELGLPFTGTQFAIVSTLPTWNAVLAGLAADLNPLMPPTHLLSPKRGDV